MADDIYYNVRRMKNLQAASDAHERESPSSPAAPVHRQPHGRSVARARLPRAGDRQSGRRPRGQPRAPRRRADGSRSSGATSGASIPATRCSRTRALVFHFAGIGDIVPSIERPTDYMDTNVQGTVRVLECARAAKVEKFVYAASSSCYGLAAVPTREDHPIAPEHPYALSKYLGETAVLHWHQVYRLPANSIRIFNAYGPRVRTTGAYGAVFGVFFKQKLAGKPFTVIGDGTQRRDFLYVTDIAEAFLRAAESDRSRRRSGISAPAIRRASIGWSNFSAARSCIFRSGRESPTAPGRISARFTRDLGWKPVVPFDQGVRRMMEDIELWRDAPLWDPQSITVATKTWFEYLGTGGLRSWNLLGSHYKHKIKTAGGNCGARRRPAAQAQGDHVPWRVRRRASGAFAASALRQEQGRHSGRQPDRRPPHLEGRAIGRTCRRTCARSISPPSRSSTT